VSCSIKNFFRCADTNGVDWAFRFRLRITVMWPLFFWIQLAVKQSSNRYLV
jgi:hypothetical protein